MAEPPRTEEGWYALHDFRRVDWDAWRDAPERARERALGEGVDYLRAREDVADAPEGDSGLFAVLGHESDLLVLHFRPTLDALERAERAFEHTAFAAFTEQSNSYVSVTEVSGYVSDDYFEDPESVDDGLRRYIEGKLTPEVPDDGYVSFYPMRKRRDPEYNWYDLAFEDRADLMADHGDVGREHAGRIRQVIASSVGLDDWEWSVTLFGDDPADIKDIVYEMRFDEASSKYGEFGEFLVGRRFPPEDLPAYMAGDAVPATEADGAADEHADAAEAAGSPHAHGEAGGSANGRHAGHGASDDQSHGDAGSDADAGGADADETPGGDEADIRERLADLDVYAGQPHGEDVYALVLYSEADPAELSDAVAELRESFEHYDTHVKTATYEALDGDRLAIASVWETASAADTASGFLADLPGVTGRAREGDGWGTMGMFYTVKPERRDEFVEKFDEVGDLLEDMDGHRETALLVNREDENDTFIASEWRSKEDAMSFFRSDAFGDTVSWGRDVLADRPRHVFLA